MTKAKRQLRAEAVERLKTMDKDPTFGYVAMTVVGRPVSGKEWRDALIDLLTDNEPPEGDPVGIMRGLRGIADVPMLRDALCRETGTHDLVSALGALADMVERDYVRRGDYDAKCAEFSAMRDRTWGAEAERDYWERQVQACMDAAYPPGRSAGYAPGVMAYPGGGGCAEPATMVCAVIDGLRDERDEWRAKAEGPSNGRVGSSMTNLEWLMDEDPFFRAFCNWYAVERFHADDDVEAYGWLLAERADADGRSNGTPNGTEAAESVRQADLPDTDRGQGADMSGNSPDCVRDDASASENGVSDGAEAELKLERARREFWQHVASKHAAKMRRLRKQLEAREGIDKHWPRFPDGQHVAIGDKMLYDGKAERVQGIRFYHDSIVFEFPGVDHCRETRGFAFGQDVKRPPLLAADGQPIEVGQVLYGESDGMAWEITHVDGRFAWGNGEKGRGYRLRPGWLAHEEPDSASRIMSDHTREVCALIEARGGVVPDEFAIANRGYIDRIEKLAGGT